MTTPQDNPTDQPAPDLDEHERDFFALAKEYPAARARIEKLISDLESFASDVEALFAYSGTRKAEREAAEVQRQTEQVDAEEQRVGRSDETRRRAWSIMGTLIWSGVIECPDVDIIARTLETSEDLKACRNVLENVQFIIGHIELALNQVLI